MSLLDFPARLASLQRRLLTGFALKAGGDLSTGFGGILQMRLCPNQPSPLVNVQWNVFFLIFNTTPEVLSAISPTVHARPCYYMSAIRVL